MVWIVGSSGYSNLWSVSMSWLPLYNAWMICLALLSIFLWKLWGVAVFVLAAVTAVLYVSWEVLACVSRYKLAFWLFIFSEVAAFATLFMVVAWGNWIDVGHISAMMELPFWGCFLLIGSSLTASAYHSCVDTELGSFFLGLTMFLGLNFIGLQLWEFYDCECDILNHLYHAASFCTVGLHFTHVVIGLAGLTVLMIVGARNLSKHYVDILVWYWHFVDYVWVFVFILVYGA